MQFVLLYGSWICLPLIVVMHLHFHNHGSKWDVVTPVIQWIGRCKVMIESTDTEDESDKNNWSKPFKMMVHALSSIWQKEGFLILPRFASSDFENCFKLSALMLVVKEKTSNANEHILPYGWSCLNWIKVITLLKEKSRTNKHVKLCKELITFAEE